MTNDVAANRPFRNASPEETLKLLIELKFFVLFDDQCGSINRHQTRKNYENIKHVLFHPGFPVDIRHNAKIGREKLAKWAEDELA